MSKVQSLYDYLIAELKDYSKRKQDLHVFMEEGDVESYPGNENRNFRMHYSAVVLLERCKYSAEQVAFVLLQWLAANQTSQANNKPLRFDGEILDNNTVDLMFSVALSETVKVTDVENMIQLGAGVEFQHDIPGSGNLDLRIEHDPTGPDAE